LLQLKSFSDRKVLHGQLFVSILFVEDSQPEIEEQILVVGLRQVVEQLVGDLEAALLPENKSLHHPVTLVFLEYLVHNVFSLVQGSLFDLEFSECHATFDTVVTVEDLLLLEVLTYSVFTQNVVLLDEPGCARLLVFLSEVLDFVLQVEGSLGVGLHQLHVEVVLAGGYHPLDRGLHLVRQKRVQFTQEQVSVVKAQFVQRLLFEFVSYYFTNKFFEFFL